MIYTLFLKWSIINFIISIVFSILSIYLKMLPYPALPNLFGGLVFLYLGLKEHAKQGDKN